MKKVRAVGRTSGMGETFEQLDELLVTLGANVVIANSTRRITFDTVRYSGERVSLCAACFSTAGRVNGRLK